MFECYMVLVFRVVSRQLVILACAVPPFEERVTWIPLGLRRITKWKGYSLQMFMICTGSPNAAPPTFFEEELSTAPSRTASHEPYASSQCKKKTS